MPTSETNPKPATEKPTNQDAQDTREEDKNVDRDGRERQPPQQSDRK